MSKFVNQIYSPHSLTTFPFGASSLHLIFPFSVTTLPFIVAISPLSLGEGRGEDSLFFRLEPPFLTFFVLLYHIMIQPPIHPSYTNRPRFV